MKKAAVLWLIGWAFFGFPWTDFTPHARFDRASLVPFHQYPRGRRDMLRNFVYYVPVGVIGLGLRATTGSVIAGGAALSATTEVVQLFSTNRYPSVTDFMINVSGAAAGILVVHARRRLVPRA
jgi:glycopeptide antibiotics resistance protein